METRWTQIVEAKGDTTEAKLALKELTAIYYEPVYRFIRDRTNQQDARDLTQEFFERVLYRYGFEGADPRKGRFRSFLLGAVKHFLAEHHAKSNRQKRGGGVPHESLDDPGSPGGSDSSPGLQVADGSLPAPDEAFDRHWAHTVLERALARVESRCAAEGKAKQYEVLQPWLAGGTDTPQADAARELGMSDSAVRVAIHRLRDRFRSELRSELSQTIGPNVTVEEELQHLFRSLA